MGVAEAAIAAPADDDALADLGEIGDRLLLVLDEDLRADRDLQHRIGAPAARAVLPHAVPAGLGLEMLLITKVDERVEPVDAFGDDIAAAPAVAAVGPAELDELLAPKRHAAGAAVARTHMHLGLIEELHRGPIHEQARLAGSAP